MGLRFGSEADIRVARRFERLSLILECYANAKVARRNSTWRGRATSEIACDVCGGPVTGRHLKRHNSSRAHGSCIDMAKKFVREVSLGRIKR